MTDQQIKLISGGCGREVHCGGRGVDVERNGNWGSWVAQWNKHLVLSFSSGGDLMAMAQGGVCFKFPLPLPFPSSLK